MWVKDRHQWLGCEFCCSLLKSMDKLFLKDIMYCISLDSP